MLWSRVPSGALTPMGQALLSRATVGRVTVTDVPHTEATGWHLLAEGGSLIPLSCQRCHTTSLPALMGTSRQGAWLRCSRRWMTLFQRNRFVDRFSDPILRPHPKIFKAATQTLQALQKS